MSTVNKTPDKGAGVPAADSFDAICERAQAKWALREAATTPGFHTQAERDRMTLLRTLDTLTGHLEAMKADPGHTQWVWPDPATGEYLNPVDLLLGVVNTMGETK